MSVIDCRGLTCPQPVITTKQALEELKEGELVVIVDNASSCGNVERFAQSQGCKVEVKRREQDFCLHIQKSGLRMKRERPDLTGTQRRSWYTSTLNSSEAAMRYWDPS